jgi:hypothetical protein
MKKIKQIKKVSRDENLKAIRKYGDEYKLPGNRIFKDKKKHAHKYASRKPINKEDY